MTLIDAVAAFHANPASLRPAPLPPTPASKARAHQYRPGVSLRLGQIVDALGGRLEGADRDTEIQRIAPLESAGPGDLAFLSNPRPWQEARKQG